MNAKQTSHSLWRKLPVPVIGESNESDERRLEPGERTTGTHDEGNDPHTVPIDPAHADRLDYQYRLLQLS